MFLKPTHDSVLRLIKLLGTTTGSHTPTDNHCVSTLYASTWNFTVQFVGFCDLTVINSECPPS